MASAQTWIRSWTSPGGTGWSSIEDACQAHGAEYKGRRAGGMGDMGCFSFYPGKNLGAYGEGGMVTTDNPEFTRTIRMLRDWGAEKKYHHVLKGYNFRMEGIQGAVLRVKLRYLEGWTEARRTAAGTLRPTAHWQWRADAEGDAAQPARLSHLCDPHGASGRRGRRRCSRKACRRGIHYPTPVHLLPAFADLGYRAGQFPHSESAANEVLSLPMFPELTHGQCEQVARAVTNLASGSAIPISAVQAV